MVKAYITSHVISKGIEEVEGEFYRGSFRYADSFSGRYSRFAFAPKNEFFLNREEAVAHAEEIKRKRLASLHEQIARLERLHF